MSLESVGFASVTSGLLRPSGPDTNRAIPDVGPARVAVAQTRDYVDLTPGVTEGQPQVSDIKPKAPKTVVFALYDKVTLQDVAAPLEIFARANGFTAYWRATDGTFHQRDFDSAGVPTGAEPRSWPATGTRSGG